MSATRLFPSQVNHEASDLAGLVVALGVAGGCGGQFGPGDQQTTERVFFPERAKKYHRGALPCLRYIDDQTTSLSEAKDVARAVADTKLTGTQLAYLVGHFVKEHRTREATLHEHSYVEETLAELDKLPKHVLERLYYLTVYRPRIEREITAMLNLLEESEAESETAWARLPAAQRSELTLVSVAHPLYFTPSGVITMLPTVKWLSTERQLQQWVPMVRDAQRKRGHFPVGIEDLPLSAELKNDDWGQPITVSALDGHVVLRSADEDGTLKTDDDLIIEFDVDQP